MLAISAEKPEGDFINISNFRLQIVDRRFKSEILNLKSVIWEKNGLQTYSRTRDDQKYGQGLYGEAYQAHCLPV